MITSRKLVIPIFEVPIHVYIFDNWDEIADIYEEHSNPKGLTELTANNIIRVFILAKYPSTIVHEAEHVKNMIWFVIGYTPQRDNDEVDAYLLKYIYNRIVDVYYKHTGNKKEPL